MKKSLVLVVLALVLITSSAYAKNTISLTCATEKGQDRANMDGYQVIEGVVFGQGGPQSKTTLVPVVNGSPKKGTLLKDAVQDLTKEDLEDSTVAAIIKASGVMAKKVSSGKYVEITDGSPSVTLMNLFDRDGEMLTGAIIVPAGGIQLCYPITE